MSRRGVRLRYTLVGRDRRPNLEYREWRKPESWRLVELSGLPFVLCGTLKIAYDLALLRSFRHLRPPEEKLSR